LKIDNYNIYNISLMIQNLPIKGLNIDDFYNFVKYVNNKNDSLELKDLFFNEKNEIINMDEKNNKEKLEGILKISLNKNDDNILTGIFII
jgi:hypothetical protein